jgi:cytochrome c
MKLKALVMIAILFPAAVLAANEKDKEMAAMLELADASRCLVCHDVDSTVTGPAWRDVGKRYRDDKDIEEILVKRVYEGSSGNWGQETMSANKRAGLDNIRVLVHWILGLR